MANPDSKICPVSAETIERLKSISGESITTQLFRRGLRQCSLVGLRPVNPTAARFCGEAFTMRLIPAREDIDTLSTISPHPSQHNLQWEAVERIQKGNVLVIDSRNDTRASAGGSILLRRMKVRGVAAVVNDGAFRDGAELAALNFPAFSREITATTRICFHHTADLQVPIACAGVAVYPGDVVRGDEYGVTIVPRCMAGEIVEDAANQDELEGYLALRIAAGESLYGVYPPTDQTKADFALWKSRGSRPEEVSRIIAKMAGR